MEAVVRDDRLLFGTPAVFDATQGFGDTRVLEMNADPVRDFYTNHPYPPPVANLDRARDEWRDKNRHRAEYHLLWPDRPYRADLDILVAGCGTWQAAKYALCQPDARIVGIDVSTTSLDHTASIAAAVQPHESRHCGNCRSSRPPRWTHASI